MNIHRLLVLSICISAQMPLTAVAVNPTFQDFFFSVCQSPAGQLADRCAETNGGLGDLSGDSESSLNPSQTLGSFAGLNANSEQRLAQARKEDGAASVTIPVAEGRASLLFNVQQQSSELDRRVDVDALRGYDADGLSVQAGVDYRVSDRWSGGVLLQWARSDLEFDAELPGNNFSPIGEAGEIAQDGLGASVFVTGNFGNSYVELAAGYLAQDYNLSRRALFQESNRLIPTTAVVTDADTDGSELWLRGSWGMTFNRGGLSFGPYVSLESTRFELDGYTEDDRTGSGLAMRVDDLDRRSLRGAAGWQTALAISGNGFVFIPQLRIEYLHEFKDSPDRSRVQFVQDTSNTQLNLRGDDRDRSAFDISVGGVWQLKNGLSAFVEVRSTQGRQDFDGVAFAAGARFEL